ARREDDVGPCVEPTTPARGRHAAATPSTPAALRSRGRVTLQPIVVRVVGDHYEIVGGHRRFAAVCELARDHPGVARFARIAAMVVEVDDAALGILQLAENVN